MIQQSIRFWQCYRPANSKLFKNSLDAKIRENNNPVIVCHLSLAKIKTNDIPKINRISEFALPKAEEFLWKR